MSREVLGLAPADAGAGRAGPSSDTSGPLSTRGRAMALLAAAAAGSLLGWTLTGSARTATRDGNAPAVTAQVVRGLQDFAAEGIQGTLQVSVLNGTSRAVRVSGYDLSLSAAAITQVGTQVIPAGRSRQVDVRVTVECQRPLPLRLPSLHVQMPDGAQLALPVRGSGAALADLCQARPATRLLVSDGEPHRDRQYYGLQFRSPSGRATQVRDVRVGGFDMSEAPQPAMIGRDGTTIWLNPPARCPRNWQVAGLPGVVDVDIDLPAQESATVSVDVGPGLAQWLLETACPAGPA